MSTYEMLLRTALSFIVLLVLTRILGHKQIGQLTFFNYVTGITFGSTAAEIMVNHDVSKLGGISSLTLWALLTFLVAYIGMKSGKARVLLDGQPTIVIKKGKLLKKALASQRLNIDDLSMMLRAKNIFTISEVDYAILEPNGQISVLKKPEYENPTREDFQFVPPPNLVVPSEVIVDGALVEKNLKELNVTRSWLNNQLHMNNVSSVKEVLYAELQKDRTLLVVKKEDSI
ncbi:DUF421 domain-containing protein [Pontibacillus marinus]|uniref:DUF421 domain-containing protein n=1 Tax=Pontibacillus marinus BH030004 = DSM 16465 TaxID=1385511 RepID=A0A0A5G3G9_9BACI|nr:DUF421 domain-containing protein [Pontibacillus marinus]KGX85625.1 hypothetical protein N783_14115 [Pontibacillus marinus BH030004 = DSM 16465]